MRRRENARSSLKNLRESGDDLDMPPRRPAPRPGDTMSPEHRARFAKLARVELERMRANGRLATSKELEQAIAELLRDEAKPKPPQN